MGELVAGKPALKLGVAVSMPLDLVSIMSLLYRAVPGSGLAPWLVRTRRALPATLRADLDLLHGFSGRLLYYMEEPSMRFEPLRPDRLDASFDDLVTFLDELSPAAYREMAIHALQRVHRDLETGQATPTDDDPAAWRAYVEPALTTAGLDQTVALLAEPDRLKALTIGVIRGIWEQVYEGEFANRLPALRESARLAEPAMARGFSLAFVDLTGNRVPATLVADLPEIERVTFCPSYHLGSFVSYIFFPTDLVIFFGAPELIARTGGAVRNGAEPAEAAGPAPISLDAFLESLRALADANRLRILDLLGEGELYAQEIVGRLGIAQSAVSRHLALLERARLVRVRPHGGMKYYSVDVDRLNRVAAAIQAHGQIVSGNGA